ncbi:MAG TPA: hypothetical protein VN089_26825, partial [Duganella sp.]|nr:hypothetical protein [Duganella sp.]
MPTSIAVVPVIETTSVMEQFGFVSAASINALAFVGDPLRNDALGMISFDAAGVQSHAPGGRLSTVDGTLPQPAAANDAPTSPSVNIGGGLRTAYALLANAPGGLTTGALLLSTGQQDSGTDPATLSRYVPTWVCALGPTANTALLRQISLLSHGQYLYVPTPADISAAVNQIRGQLPGWTTLLNQSKAVEARGFWLQPVTIAPGCSAAQFSVVWENPHLTCTSSSNPGPNQISVTLVQPPGITLATPPSACGGGYCVFNVRDPVSSPGPWYVQVMYPDGATLPIAIGVFGQYGDAGVKLEIVPSGSPRAGHALVAQ